MTRRSDQAQLEREPEKEGPRPPDRAPTRAVWNWFGAVFGIVVLLGVGILYFFGTSGPEIDEAEAAEQPVTAEEAQPAEPPATVAPSDEPTDEATDEATEEFSVAISGQTSSVLLGMYVVDSFGFHGLEEAYAEATEVGDRDAGQVAKVLAAVDAVEWPDELSEFSSTFRGDVAGLHEALEAGDIEGARLGLEAVHGSQHDLSNGVYEWLGTAEPDGSTSSVLLGMYVVDSFGFHGLEEAYAEATEVGDRDAGQVAKVLAAVDAVEWPDELSEFSSTFRGDVAGLHEALEAGDIEGARLGLEAVHGSQHDLSNGVYEWLGTAEPDGSTSSVLLGMYVVDSFGFHGLEEAYAEATEVGDRDAGQVAKVLAAVDAVEWPDELSEFSSTFRGDVAGLHEALEAGDIEGARLGLEAVHGSQHDLSNGVYAWLAGTPVGGHDDGVEAGQSVNIIEIEMTEFAYEPETIEIQAGAPVILRFTNTGKLEHEAMVGDGHMQEEWAAASEDGGHDPNDGHHGDLMAVTVLPGEIAELEVHIDEPGTWYMACHLTGHYEQGQVATINVTS